MKRQSLLMLCLMVSLLFFGGGFLQSQTVLLNENFNSMTGAEAVPSGWDNSDYTCATGEVWKYYNNAADNYDGVCLRFNSYNSSEGEYSVLKTPAFNISVPVELSFMYKNPTGGEMIVYLNNTVLDTLTNVTNWTEYVFPLNAFVNSTDARVVFKSISNSGSGKAYHYLDNVRVAEPPTCKKPINLIASYVTTNSATFSWELDSRGNDPSAFRVTIREVLSGNTICSDSVVITSFNTFTINGLNPNTAYAVTVRSDCSNNNYGYSEYTPYYSFTTLCNIGAFPVVNNFDSETGDIPACWTIPAEYNQGTKLQSTVTSTGSGKALLLNYDNSKNGFIATNSFVAKADSIQVNLKYYATSNSMLEVGITKSPYDLSYLVIIGTVNISNTNSWVPVRVNSSIISTIPDYGDTVCVVLRASSGAVYIDDFSAVLNEGCSRLENVSISDVTYNSAVVNWDPEFIPAANYVARLATANDTSFVSFSQVPYTLSLQQNTDYSISVAAVCNQQDTSEWSVPVAFSTLCYHTGSGFFEDFEGSSLPECWLFVQTKLGTGSGSDRGAACWVLNSSTSYTNNSKKSIKAQQSKAGGRYIAVLPAMNIPTANAYDVNFYMYRYTTTSAITAAKLKECINVWVNTTPDTIGGTKLGSVSTYAKGYPIVDEKGMYEYYYQIPMSGDVFIIFEFEAQYGTTAYIDDISVNLSPSCRKVKDIKLDGTTTNTATISWTRGENETQYLVNYRYISKYNEVNPDTVYGNQMLVNGTSCVIENLPIGDILDIKGSVASYCGVGDTSVWVDFFFDNVYTKANTYSLPFAEDFNRVSSSLFPPAGWSRAVIKEDATKTTSYGEETWIGASTTSATSNYYNIPGGANFKKCTAGNRVVLATPALDFDPAKRYQVVFTMYRHSTNKANEGLRILVSPTPDDTLNAVAAGFYNAYYKNAPAEAKSAKYEYTLELPANISGIKYVLFEGISNNGNTFYIDDVYIEEVPDCKRLKDFNLEALSKQSVRVELTDTSWHNDTWQVCFGEVGFNPDEATNIFTSNGGVDTIVATGLMSDYQYEVYIRRYCSSESQSPWSRASKFVRTHCDAVTIDLENGFTEDFENRFVVKSTSTDTIKGCYFQKYQREKSTSTSGYLYCVEKTSVSNPTAEVLAYKGNRFARNSYNYHNWIYRHFHLEAGKQYKMQIFGCIPRKMEDDDTQGAYFAMGYSTEADTAKLRQNSFLSTFTNSTTWIPVTGYFTVPQTGDYYLGLYSFATNSSVVNSLCIDEWTVSEITCVPPLNIEAKATTDSATITYTYTADSVEVRISSIECDKYYPIYDVYKNTLVANSVKIGGLTPNTDYWYTVRSFCSGKPSEWSDVAVFRTNCDAVALPIQENFELKSDIACWSSLGYNSNSKFKISSDQQKVGHRSLNAKSVTVISPKLDVTSLANVTISGYAYSDNENASFDIGIVNDPTDVLTYEHVQTVTLANESAWNQFNANFSILTTPDYAEFANAKYIAIVVSADIDCYFDDVIISNAPSCPMPTNVEVVKKENDKVHLRWTAGGSETQWHVRGLRYLSDDSDADIIVDIDTIVTSNDVTFGGLYGSSNYMFEVTALCSASDVSYVAYSENFTTYCEPYNNFYDINVDDFYRENTSYQKFLPDCWLNVSYPEYKNNGWNYKRVTSGYNPPITNYYIEFTSASTNPKGNMAQLMSPIFDLTEVDTTKNETAKVFFTIENYAADTIFVCVSTDFGESIADTLMSVVYSTDDLMEYIFDREIDLKKYAGERVRIIFQTTSTGGARADLSSILNSSARARMRVFDFQYVDPCIRPTSIGVDSCKSTYVKAYITDSISSNLNWEYVAVMPGANPEAGNPVAFSTVNHYTYSQQIPFTVSNLLPSHSYDLYVRTTCGGGSVSKWFGPTTIRTSCADVINIPYNENFETLTSSALIESNSCFTFYTPAPEAETYPSYSSGSKSYAADGAYCLGMNSSAEYPLFIVLPKFNVPTNELQVNFAYRYQIRNSEDAPIVVGLIQNPSEPETFVPMAEFYCDITNTYNTVPFNVLGSEYADYYIAFKYGPSYANNRTAYIDDITVDYAPECTDVTKVDILSVTSNSISAQFYYNADTLQVAYGTVGTPVESCTIINTSDKILTINNLNKAAAYYIYYRTICNGNTSDWSEPMFITTDCDVISIPRGTEWNEDFDTYSTMAFPFPSCFERIITSSDNAGQYPVIVNEALGSNPASLLLRGENAVALPEFDLSNKALVVDFNMKGEGSLAVGVQTDLNNPSSFVKVAEFTANNNIINRVVDLSYYNLPEGRVVLRSEASSTIYIDDLEVRWSDNLCFAPRNVQIYNVTDNSVKITWETAYDVDAVYYQLYKSDRSLVSVGMKNPGEDFYIDILTPLTSYYFIIYSHCSDGTSSSNSESDTIYFTTTSADYVSVPFTTYFESDTENAGWHFENSSNLNIHKNRFVIGTDPAAVRTGSKALYVTDSDNGRYYYDENSSSDVYVYRYVNFPDPGVYVISYDWRCQGRGAIACSRMFLAPMDQEFAADDVLVPSGTALPEYATKLYNVTNLSGKNLWTTENVAFNVTKAGTYKLVLSWHNAVSTSTTTEVQPPFAIDRLFIQKQSCGIIRSVSEVSSTTNTITFTYSSTNKEATLNYSVYDVNDVNTPVATGSSNEDTITINGLNAGTEYLFVVNLNCGGADVSSSYTATFTTICDADFVSGNDIFVDDFEYMISGMTPANCWYQTILSPTNRPTQPNWECAAKNTYREPKSGNGYLSIAYGNHSAVTRQFSLTKDTIYRIQTYARGYNSNDNLNFGYLDNDGFHTLSSVNLNKEYDIYYCDFKAPATGNYHLGFMVNMLNSSVNYISIDSVVIGTTDKMRPNVYVEQTDNHCANVTWEGNSDSYRVRVYNQEKDVVILDTVVNDVELNYCGFDYSTPYDIKVRGEVNSDTTEWGVAQLNMDCGSYLMPYRYLGESHKCWETYDEIKTGSGTWIFGNTEENGITLSTLSKTGHFLAVSPAIEVLDSNTFVSFNYFNYSENSRLIVSVISDDATVCDTLLNIGGKTPADGNNAIKLPFSAKVTRYAGKNMRVRVSTRIARGDNMGSTTSGRMGIFDLRVSRSYYQPDYSDTICGNENYYAYGFNILNQEMVQGENQFTITQLVNQEGQADTIKVLNLYLAPVYSQEIFDTICPGEVYNKGLFAGEQYSVSGKYTKNFTSSYGCDSIVVLHLYVDDASTTTNAYICEGDTYNFNGEMLTESGTYTDTVVNARGCDAVVTLNLTVIPTNFEEKMVICEGDSYNWYDLTLTTQGRYTKNFTNSLGCDSIHIIDLEVIPRNIDTTITICQGSYLQFGDEELTIAGEYTNTFVNSLNCDSIVHLTLVVTDAPRNVIQDYACEGYDYNGYGFNVSGITKDTVVERIVTNLAGCDSIIEVHLTFVPTDTAHISATINQGEIYEFGGNTYSQAGEYTHRTMSSMGCDSITILTLEVVTGVDNSFIIPMVVAPNPIRGGEVTYLVKDWTDEEKAGMTVEVLNSVGQRLMMFKPNSYPISIDGIYTAGVYHIRVISGTGDVYIGKLIVK